VLATGGGGEQRLAFFAELEAALVAVASQDQKRLLPEAADRCLPGAGTPPALVRGRCGPNKRTKAKQRRNKGEKQAFLSFVALSSRSSSLDAELVESMAPFHYPFGLSFCSIWRRELCEALSGAAALEDGRKLGGLH